MLLLRVAGPGGSLCRVVDGGDLLFAELREAIEAQTGIPAARQRILCGLCEWYADDSRTVRELVLAGDGLDIRPSVCVGPGDRGEDICSWCHHHHLALGGECGLSMPGTSGCDKGVDDHSQGKRDLRYAHSQGLHIAQDEQRVGDEDWSVDLLLIQRTEEQMVLLEKLDETNSSTAREWLRKAPECAREDRDLVLAAVSKDGLSLLYASPLIKSDREVVIKAVSNNGLALQFASAELRGDRTVVLAAVADNGIALSHASVELQADHQVVMAAVSETGLALQHAGPNLRSDREVVLAALRASSGSLRFAAPELRSDLTLLHSCGLRGAVAYGRSEDVG